MKSRGLGDVYKRQASGRTISRLDCDESNPVLQPFYAGLGYTPRGAVDFDVPGMDYRVRVLRMERSLAPEAPAEP